MPRPKKRTPKNRSGDGRHLSTTTTPAIDAGTVFDVELTPDQALDPWPTDPSDAPAEEGHVLDVLAPPSTTPSAPTDHDIEFSVPGATPGDDLTITLDDQSGPGSGQTETAVSPPAHDGGGAALMDDGTVVIAGGQNASGAAAGADIFAAPPTADPGPTGRPDMPESDPPPGVESALDALAPPSTTPSTPAGPAGPDLEFSAPSDPAAGGVEGDGERTVFPLHTSETSKQHDDDDDDDRPGAPWGSRSPRGSRGWLIAALGILFVVALVLGLVIGLGGSSNPPSHHSSAGSAGSATPGSSGSPTLGGSTPTGSATSGETGLPSTGGSNGSATAAPPAAPAAPVITKQPTSQTCSVGQTVTFSVSATGSPPPTIQWQLSPNHGQQWNLVAGGTAPNYSLQCAKSYNGWEFRAVVTNSQGTVTSSVAGIGVS